MHPLNNEWKIQEWGLKIRYIDLDLGKLKLSDYKKEKKKISGSLRSEKN